MVMAKYLFCAFSWCLIQYKKLLIIGTPSKMRCYLSFKNDIRIGQSFVLTRPAKNKHMTSFGYTSFAHLILKIIYWYLIPKTHLLLGKCFPRPIQGSYGH